MLLNMLSEARAGAPGFCRNERWVLEVGSEQPATQGCLDVLGSTGYDTEPMHFREKQTLSSTGQQPSLGVRV